MSTESASLDWNLQNHYDNKQQCPTFQNGTLCESQLSPDVKSGEQPDIVKHLMLAVISQGIINVIKNHRQNTQLCVCVKNDEHMMSELSYQNP